MDSLARRRESGEPSVPLMETAMPDIEITCAECGNAFPFTEREQEYYQERNLTHPKRCKPCRDARRSNFGGPKGAGGERQRFEITCDQCGKTDTVPFKPSTGRPVLCGDCFSASRAAQPRT
jgi:CxxC-x17-CxxC domain-containing protein